MTGSNGICCRAVAAYQCLRCGPLHEGGGWLLKYSIILWWEGEEEDSEEIMGKGRDVVDHQGRGEVGRWGGPHPTPHAVFVVRW